MPSNHQGLDVREDLVAEAEHSLVKTLTLPWLIALSLLERLPAGR